MRTEAQILKDCHKTAHTLTSEKHDLAAQFNQWALPWPIKKLHKYLRKTYSI